MSKFFREKGIEKLSSRVRHLAVHSIARWSVDGLNLLTRKQFYRAVIQDLFVRHGIEVAVGRMGEPVYRGTFEEYVPAVVKRLGLSENLVQEADIVDSYDTQDILASIVLGGMCASILESLIIVDRYMAVREAPSGGYVGLDGLFNPEVSPRGWAIVASRS
jgi:hypothetical protein